MRKLWFILLLSGSFVLAQDKPSNPGQEKSKVSKGQITVQGCVATSSGDYTLFKQDPAITYELEATGKSKIKLGQYLGQQVEVIGTESPSLSTSSDFINKIGFSILGDVNHHLDQDHQEVVYGTTNSRVVGFRPVPFGSDECLIGNSRALSCAGRDCAANLPRGQGAKMLHESPPARVTILACNHVPRFVNSRFEYAGKGIE